MHSDGDEPSSPLDCYWFYICHVAVLSVLSFGTLALEAYLQNEKYFQSRSTRGRCLLMSVAPQMLQLHDKCPGTPQCIASFQEWFLKHFFSRSPFLERKS